MNNRWTLIDTALGEQVVKKSRFLAFAGPVANEADAKAFIALHSDPSASHNCWAWRVGHAYRFSDDGEPSGTAGKPILQAIDGHALDGVAIVVVRWFGGILLGSGGLVRAYGGTAAACLRQAEKAPLRDLIAGTVNCSFSDAPLLQARLGHSADVQVVGQDFTATGAQLVIAVERDAADLVDQLVANLTSGRSFVSWTDQ